MSKKYKTISIVSLIILFGAITTLYIFETKKINENSKPDIVYPDVKEFNDLKKCNNTSECLPSCAQEDCFNRQLVNDCVLMETFDCVCKNNLCQKVNSQ